MSTRDQMLAMPALPPPAGVEPNFEHPPANRALVLGIMVPCLTITTIGTLLRLYVKTFIMRKWHLEDWLLPLVFAFTVAGYVPVFHVYTFAPVVHQWNLRLGALQSFLLDVHVGLIFYDVTMLTLKLAILVQFLRIFIPERNFSYWATHALIWCNTIFYLAMLFVQLFACKPIRKQWDPLVTGGSCLDIPLTYLISQSFNFALDALILVWTQAIIWTLHMSITKRIKLGVLFFAGLIGVVAAAGSIFMNARMFNTDDQSYWYALSALMIFPETTAGFLVLSLPVVPKFVSHVRAKYNPAATRSSIPSRTNTFDSPQRKAPRSWWHVSADSWTSKPSSSETQIHPLPPPPPVFLRGNGTMTRQVGPPTKRESEMIDVPSIGILPPALDTRLARVDTPSETQSPQSLRRTDTHDSERILRAQSVRIYRPVARSNSRPELGMGPVLYRDECGIRDCLT